MTPTDCLTAEVTAFPTLAELLAACATGYRPSLYPRQGRGKAVAADNARRAALVEVLATHGIAAWLGR